MGRKKPKLKVEHDPALEAMDVLVEILEGSGASTANDSDQGHYWDSLSLSLDVLAKKLDKIKTSKSLHSSTIDDIPRMQIILEIEETAQEIRSLVQQLSDETTKALPHMIGLCQSLELSLTRLRPLARALKCAICRQSWKLNHVLQLILQSLSNLYIDMDQTKTDILYASESLRRRCIDSKTYPWKDAIIYLAETSKTQSYDEVMGEVEVDFDVDMITQNLSKVGLASKPLFNPDLSIANESLIDCIKAFLFENEPEKKNFTSILMIGPEGSGKTFQCTVIERNVRSHVEVIRPCLPHDLMGKTIGSSEDLILSLFAYAKNTTKPSLIILDDIETIIGCEDDASANPISDTSGDYKTIHEPHVTARIRTLLFSLLDTIQATESHNTRTLLLCTSKINFGKSMGRFEHVYTLSTPNVTERREIILQHLRHPTFEPSLLSNLVECTSGLSYAELAQYCRQAVLQNLNQEKDFNITFLEVLKEQIQMSVPESLRMGVNTDFIDMKVMSAKDLREQSNTADPSMTNLPLFGKGMESAWQELLRSIVVPVCQAGELNNLLHQNGGRSGKIFAGGVILTGPPGCGKSALAYHCALVAATINPSIKLVDVSCTSLISKEVGSSERSIHRLFEAARSATPCILLMDGIETVAAVRGNDNTTEGTMDRVLSTLLTELDGVDSEEYSLDKIACLAIIGITHNFEWIDPALRRPGRLGKVIQVGRPEHEARKKIAGQELRESNLAGEDGAFDDMVELIAQETEGYTAAGVIALCNDAKMHSSKEWCEDPEGHEIELKLRHVVAAINEKYER